MLRADVNQKTDFRLCLVYCFLVLLPLTAFSGVRQNQFLHYDDDVYVSENPHLAKGLNWEGIRWAFTADLTHDSPNADYWQPVTFISHLLGASLFGWDPAAHHLMNLAIHAANALLLFYLLKTMTGAVWRSAFAVAIFAVHPVQTEVVAWVTARKDVLSTFFGLLTILVYVRLKERPILVRMAGVSFCFALAVMSKPAVMAIPFLLLLFDFWPLGRLTLPFSRSNLRGLVLEKLPLFLMALGAMWVAVKGQPQAFTYSSAGSMPANILMSYARAFGKMMAPVRLGIYGPIPEYEYRVPFPELLGIGVLMAAFLAGAFWQAPKRPYLLVGAGWYLAALAPTTPLAWSADRFLYFAMIGLVVSFVWWGVELAGGRLWTRVPAVAAGLALVVVFAGKARAQTVYWKNDQVLFERAIQLNPYNYVAHNNLGNALIKAGKIEEALQHYVTALNLRPDYVEAYNNQALVAADQGQMKEAFWLLEEALRHQPHYAKAHYNLANLCLQNGMREEAIRHYQEALNIYPHYEKARAALIRAQEMNDAQ